MDKENRFDHIVGLIYDSAHSEIGLDSVIDAIGVEFEASDASPGTQGTNRQLLRSYVNHAAGVTHGPANAPTDNRLKEYPLLRRLTPHFARSASLRNRVRELEDQQTIRQIEVALLPLGLVWIGSGQKVVSANSRATQSLSAQDGLGIHECRLRAWMSTDTERLTIALSAALRPTDRKGRLLAIRRQGQALPLLASVIPANTPPLPGHANPGPFALVVLQNPDEAAIGLEHMQAIYGFTNAERALAEALLNNQTLEGFADAADVSRNTVRSHLARWFAKTGTSRQAELVRLLKLARPRL